MSHPAELLGPAADSPPIHCSALFVWGLAWGGAPTLLQAAVGIVGGPAAVVASAKRHGFATPSNESSQEGGPIILSRNES